MRLALKLTKSLCIPHEFNTVLTVLISKPTKNCTVSSVYEMQKADAEM